MAQFESRGGHDVFTVRPAAHGADVPSQQRARIEVEEGDFSPRVTVEFRGEEWVFERNRKGGLRQVRGEEVPTWLRAAVRSHGVGRVP